MNTTRRAAIVALFSLGLTSAASPSQARTALAGDWQTSIKLDNQPHNLTLTFTPVDSAWIGSLSDSCWVTRDNVCAQGGRGPMEHLTVAGDTVTFTVSVLEFTGVVTGTTMKGKLMSPLDHITVNFVATKKRVP